MHGCTGADALWAGCLLLDHGAIDVSKTGHQLVLIVGTVVALAGDGGLRGF